MRSGLLRLSRALAAGWLACGLVAVAAHAATSGSDSAIARAGVLMSGDFPAGFTASADSSRTHADNIRLAKSVAGCGPYVTLQKTVVSLPQAQSGRFGDGSRSVGNEIDVFASQRRASAALTLYAKSSVVGCLEHLLETQIRQDPAFRDVLDDVVVTLERQDIASLGDDSVVYEGHVVLTATDRSRKQLGVGRAAVRVGRAVNVVTYSTEGADLTEILTPAIDKSVARLRASLAGRVS